MKDLHIDNRPVDMAGFIANNGTLPGVCDFHIHYHLKVWSKNFLYKRIESEIKSDIVKKIFKWHNYDLFNFKCIQESQFPKKYLAEQFQNKKVFNNKKYLLSSKSAY